MSFPIVFLICLGLASAAGAEIRSNPIQTGGELRFTLGSEPKSLHPLQVTEVNGELLRYITHGVLIRMNRSTQKPEGELAESWKISDQGRRITVELRKNLKFSDGSPFDSADVVFTLAKLLDKSFHSPIAEAFQAAGTIKATAVSPSKVTLQFESYIAGVERLFDDLSILSSRSPKKEAAGMGPFTVVEVKAGSYMRLARNPNYWKRNSAGQQLPYLDGIRIEFQRNRDLELIRFQKEELDILSNVEPEAFNTLKNKQGITTFDLGTSLDTVQVWFNQVATAPIAAHKKEWFKSSVFRLAISEAINRQDMARVVYHGYGVPAAGFISPANLNWSSREVSPLPYQPQQALAKLTKAGFQYSNGNLSDKFGNPVEFTLVTNSGNKVRERLAAMMQADLKQIGIKVQVATLDFPSLIERIMRNFNYDACLLGMVSSDLDPSAMMNVMLSSGPNHAWNPNQKSPATAWEAEIDKLMHQQATEISPKKRKAEFDKAQSIFAKESPILYLVNKNALGAASAKLRNVKPSILSPQMLWNVEEIHFGTGALRASK